jgi:hypothetical protein
MNSHLTQRELLLYVDGELSLWRSWQTQAHLLSCWSCRRELERLEQDINAIVDAQNRSFLPSTPRLIRPWDNFEELAAALPAPRLGVGMRLRQAGNLLSSDSLSSLRWATGVVTLVCFVVTALWLLPERLSAQVVLRRMEQAELVRRSVNTGQVIRQRLRVERIDRRSSTRRSVEMESWNVGARSVWRGDIRDLEQRYRRLGLASTLPLSAVAAERWLLETQAEPRASRTGDGVELEAHDSRAGAELESVNMRVQSGTWRLEGIRLTFTNDIFDVAEVDFAILKKSELSSDLLAELEPPAAPEARFARVRSGLPGPRPELDAPPPNLIEEELRIQYRLHEVGADLSEPIELKQDQGKIVISARAASDERKQQLAEMFGGDPRIRLETEVSPIPLTTTAPRSIAPSSAAERSPDKQLTEFFGSAEGQENFTRAVLGADALVLAPLYALQNLSQHWPSNVEPTLSAESREELDAMVNDYLHRLGTSLPELKQLLGPFLERFCGPNAAAPDTPPSYTDWRKSVTAGLEAARTLDRNLKALLTMSANGRTLPEACPDLKSALLELSSYVGTAPPKW